VAVTVTLLLTASGGALAQPTPGPGPWSAVHPLWFDLNGDGIAQASELAGYPSLQGTDCTQILGYPTVIGSPQSPCADLYVDDGVGGSINRPNGVVQTLSSNADGTVFTFTEGFSVPTANGTGQLLDTNADGIYDSLEIQGTRPSGPVPQTRMSLVPRDATGDGRPDYLTLPWTTSGAGMLGVFTGVTPQIYVPLTDTDSDGWPDTITVQVANGGIVTTSGPRVAGVALAPAAMVVPSASTLGLFVFAAAVVAFGVKLLRGSVVAS
jgi:hypothetical protein